MPASVSINTTILAQERKAKGWTVDDLARITGRDPRTIERVLSLGTTSLPTASALADALGIALDRLLAEDHARTTGTISNIPLNPNPFFSGRDEPLRQLSNFTSAKSGPRIAAVSGLGGIGKTQLVIEFAQNHISPAWVLWCSAASSDEIRSGYFEIGKLLGRIAPTTLPSSEAFDAAVSVVNAWLTSNDDWVFIMDNADTPAELAPFLPTRIAGHIILTSRAQVFDEIGLVEAIQLSDFSLAETELFLGARLQRKLQLSEGGAIEDLHSELGGLPLALEQAASYIVEKRVSDIGDYYKEFQKHRLSLLNKQKPRVGSYNETVATTWSMNFEEVQRESSVAADLMRFTAFLKDSRPIQFDYIVNAASVLPVGLRELIEQAAVKRLAVQEALAPLARFSLVGIQPSEHTYTMHLLVQEVSRAIAINDN